MGLQVEWLLVEKMYAGKQNDIKELFSVSLHFIDKVFSGRKGEILSVDVSFRTMTLKSRGIWGVGGDR